MNTVKLFVYGTLRVGAWNYDRQDDWILDAETDCTADGQIFFVGRGFGGYPVAKFDREGTIIGDLLTCNADSPGYHAIVRMEEGAGYEMRPILVLARNNLLVEAQAFHYRHEPRGDRIEDGDWRRAAYDGRRIT